MKVVGFAGYSGSGKTTLVDALMPLCNWGTAHRAEFEAVRARQSGMDD